jgi:hypothetical protein
MTRAEMIEWVARLQLVLPPRETCGLLVQLLQAPTTPRALLKADLLQLYDLLLQQLARSGWEAQQQAASLPPAAADVVLRLLPDASKSRSAATKVLVVWRHMAGALDPAWCGGGLAAAAAKAAGSALGKPPNSNHKGPTIGNSSSNSSSSSSGPLLPLGRRTCSQMRKYMAPP